MQVSNFNSLNCLLAMGSLAGDVSDADDGEVVMAELAVVESSGAGAVVTIEVGRVTLSVAETMTLFRVGSMALSGNTTLSGAGKTIIPLSGELDTMSGMVAEVTVQGAEDNAMVEMMAQ